MAEAVATSVNGSVLTPLHVVQDRTPVRRLEFVEVRPTPMSTGGQTTASTTQIEHGTKGDPETERRAKGGPETQHGTKGRPDREHATKGGPETERRAKTARATSRRSTGTTGAASDAQLADATHAPVAVSTTEPRWSLWGELEG